MTTGGADHILAGWRHISLIWPIVLTVASLLLIFTTVDRRAPIVDALFSAALYLVSIPLFLSDHALSSLAYHAISIPLALAALPLWRQYTVRADHPRMGFYALLGLYTAVCALGKPTFLAFATPFYAMEIIRAARTWRVGGVLFAGLSAIAIYLLWMLAYCRGFEGLIDHLSNSYVFMRSQSGMYDEAKSNWYISYVIGVMGPLPSLLIATTLGLAMLCRDRLMPVSGVFVGIASALFCLYQRIQLHAQPEFMALLLTLTIATFRHSELATRVEGFIPRKPLAIGATAASAALVIWTVYFPPRMMLTGFAEFMTMNDAVVVPSLFEQPQSVRTIALQVYPVVFYGVGDAWCRGSTYLFGGDHSMLLDNAFGNMTCMHNDENRNIDIASYNRVLFPKEIKTSIQDTMATIAIHFPSVSSRLDGCHRIDGDFPIFEVFECNLRQN
jgi:hypothetical protein